jgi:hypothetical protein
VGGGGGVGGSGVRGECGCGGWERQSAQGAMLVYPRRGWGNTVCHLVLTCWSAECLPRGLELASGGVGALLFPQCNVAWRSFPWARGSGCQSFDFPCCFISAKCGSSVSASLCFGITELTLSASVL